MKLVINQTTKLSFLELFHSDSIALH